MFACSGFCVLLMRSIWVDCCLWVCLGVGGGCVLLGVVLLLVVSACLCVGF